MENIEINVITPVDADNMPCSVQDPDYVKTVVMDLVTWAGAECLCASSDEVDIHSIQMIRPGQDDCVGRVRFWVMEDLCFHYDFVGIRIGDSLFLKREDIKAAGSESFREPEPTVADFEALSAEEQNALWETFHEKNLQGTADNMPFYRVLMDEFLVGYVGH